MLDALRKIGASGEPLERRWIGEDPRKSEARSDAIISMTEEF